jgi:hypothetical protein
MAKMWIQEVHCEHRTAANYEAYELAPPQMTELHPLPLAGLTA